jgi:hypothetical protein
MVGINMRFSQGIFLGLQEMGPLFGCMKLHCRAGQPSEIRAAGSCVKSEAGTAPAGAGRRRRDTSGTAPDRRRPWRRQARPGAGAHKKVPARRRGRGAASPGHPGKGGGLSRGKRAGRSGTAQKGTKTADSSLMRPGPQARDGQKGMTVADADVPHRRKLRNEHSMGVRGPGRRAPRLSPSRRRPEESNRCADRAATPQAESGWGTRLGR